MKDYKETNCDDLTSKCPQLTRQEERLKKILAQLFLSSQNDLWEASAAIHDRILQLLNISHLNIGTFLKTSEKTGQVILDQGQLTGLKDKIAASIEESQKLMLEISSPILKYFGLGSALEALAEERRNQRKSKIVLECNQSHLEIPKHKAQLLFSIINDLVVLAETHIESPEMKIQINQSSQSLSLSIDFPLESGSINQFNSMIHSSNVPEQFPEDQTSKRILKLAIQRELWIIFGGEFLLSSINDRKFNLKLEIPLHLDA